VYYSVNSPVLILGKNLYVVFVLKWLGKNLFTWDILYRSPKVRITLGTVGLVSE